MNILDIAIIVILLFGALIGFKRGFTRELVSLVGVILVVLAAFVLKNPLSSFLYEHLPFFGFGGIFKGVTVLNILLYEVIAFFIMVAVFMIILKILMFVTNIFEKLLTMTIILGIPSKILGAILGFIENYVIVFIVLYIMSLPLFHFDFIQGSKFKDKILNSTPLLSMYIDDTVDIANEFRDLAAKYKTETDANAFNLEALNVLLKYKVVTVEAVDKLDEKNKLQIDNIESVLQCYREGNENKKECKNK